MSTALIFIIIFASITVLIAIVSLITLLAIQKRLNASFTVEKMLEYERQIEKFYMDNDIQQQEDLKDVVAKLGLSVQVAKDLPRLVDAQLQDNIIKVRESNPLVQRKFNIAHELAHVIRKEKSGAKRERLFFSSANIPEQICDYMAAAILLPAKMMKTKIESECFFKMDKYQKNEFIQTIALDKDIENQVVERRIAEVIKLYNLT